MKACVFSDSHGLVGHMISVINLEKPDFCFFLGDGERDVVRLEENFPHFVILTREPSDSVSHIHDRMPFILPESEIETWINPRMNPYLELPLALTDMIAEKVPTGAHT